MNNDGMAFASIFLKWYRHMLQLTNLIGCGKRTFPVILFLGFTIVSQAQETFCDRLIATILLSDTTNFKKMMRSRIAANCKGAHGSSPLGVACSNGEITMVELLLKKGADPNVMQFYKGNAIGTPLFDAVFLYSQQLEPILEDTRNGERSIGRVYDYTIKDDIVKLLISNGADVKVVDYERNTLLMNAARFGRPSILKLLAEKGVDINAQNDDGYTALMNGVFSADSISVRILLELGADAKIKDISGKTALDYATVKGLRDIALMLKEND
jgi:ankyrin repeat protein